MHWNHQENISLTPIHGKSVSTKLIPSDKKVGDCCFTTFITIKEHLFCQVKYSNGICLYYSLVLSWIPSPFTHQMPFNLCTVKVSNILMLLYLQICYPSSLQFSLSVVSDSANPWTAACQDSLSITNSQACSDSCPLSWWCHPTISSSLVPFSCLQSFSGSFPMSQFFTSGGQSIGASPSLSVLPVNIQDRFPLGLTGWISLEYNGLSSIFSNTTVQKHWFFNSQLSLWSNSHIHTWLL